MLCPNHPPEEMRIAARAVGVCGGCLRSDRTRVESVVRTHAGLRRRIGLPPAIPANGTIVCPECGNHCRLVDGGIGFCGGYVARDGRIHERYGEEAVVSWYFDPLPTNCVADWVCPVTHGQTWKRRDIVRRSGTLFNLAVFYGSCNSDCLFCQNDSYKSMMASGGPRATPKTLAEQANDRTACICYFGGDPACNARHSLETCLLYTSPSPRD